MFFRIQCSSRAGLLRAKTHSGGANPILEVGGGEPAHRRNLLIHMTTLGCPPSQTSARKVTADSKRVSNKRSRDVR